MAARSILHVIPAVAARYGGPSAAVVGMSAALQGAGVRVLVASTDADGPGRLDVPLGEPTTFEGVPAVFFRRQVSEAFKWSAPFATWLRRHVRQFEVVHAHAVFSHAPLAAARACQAAGVPYVIRPLGTLDPWGVSRKGWRKRVLLQIGGQAALRGAAAMHYTSAEEQRLAEAGFPGLPPGAVIPVGIEDRYFVVPERPATGMPYALVLSRLNAVKRIEWVIDAWHRLSSAQPSAAWHLVIAGDGEPEYVRALQARAANGPAASRISFRGWVKGEAKLTLVQGADLFLVASHQESFGVAMVEAMASGVPAIMTPGVNLAREVEAAGAGWRVDETPAALYGALTRVMSDETERRTRGDRATAFARQFRWATVGQELLALYDRVIEAQGRPAQAPRPGVAPSPAL